VNTQKDPIGITLILTPRNIDEINAAYKTLVAAQQHGTVAVLRKLEPDYCSFLTISIDMEGERTP
jgi:hypothetical protein